MARTKPATIPTDDEVDARRRKYGHHLPPIPLRRTRVPSLLADRPELAALAAEREAVRAAEARLTAVHAEWSTRVELARAEHQESQRRAMLDGTEPPAPLVDEPWPYPAHTRGTFDALHAVIEATELGVLEENATRYAGELAQLAAPIGEALDEARRRVADLEDELIRFDRAREALERVTDAALTDTDEPASIVEIPRVRYDPDSSPATEADLFAALYPPRRNPRR